MVQRAGQRGRRATGITSRSDVCVAENDATLLSTRPASFAGGHDVDVADGRGLALARHDPDRAVRADARRQRLERLERGQSSRRRAGRCRCRARASPRSASVVRSAMSGRMSGSSMSMRRRASRAGGRACRAGEWCRRVPSPVSCHRHAARSRPALRHLRLRSGPPADAAPVRAGHRPAAGGRRRAGSRPGARARRRAAVVPHAALHRDRPRLLGATRTGCPRPASPRAATCRRSPGCTTRPRRSPAARSGRSRRSCAATSSTPSTRAAGCTTRCPTARRASASTTTRRWRSPARGRTVCASCTSTSTSTTATASRRSTRPTRAC